MKANLLKIVTYLSAMLGFSACDNTLDVNAEWKEIMVVYGLLNPSDAVNYVRITKAYLNPDGNAVQIAGISDSLYFDSLDVRLTEYKNGTWNNEMILELIDGNLIGIPKDSGLFANDVNYLYRLKDKVKSEAGNNYFYKIQIFNKQSGKIVSSQTEIVKPLKLISPLNSVNPNPNPLYWRMHIPDDGRPLIFSYTEGQFAKMYDLVLRFRYEEWPISNPSDVRRDSLDWLVFRDKETQSLSGITDKIIHVSGISFYNMIAAGIPVKPGFKRKSVDMDLHFYGGGQELYTYINVNKPSIGIVQKKPEYTNIEGGLGIFSSRNITRLVNIKVDSLTTVALQKNALTKALNF